MQQSTCSLHPRLCRLIIYAFMLCEMFCGHTALRRLKCIRVRVYWDSYRSLFEVSHGFIPEFLVGCVLPDQLLLLLRQLEGLLYLHPFGGRLCRGWWLWWRRTTTTTKKKRLKKAAYTWIEKDSVCLRKIRRWRILEHLQAILKTKFHCSHCSHLSFSHNTLSDLLWASSVKAPITTSGCLLLFITLWLFIIHAGH